MASWWAAAGVLALLAGPAAAQETPRPSASPAPLAAASTEESATGSTPQPPSTTASPRPTAAVESPGLSTAPARRIDLGAYGATLPGEVPQSFVGPDIPRFADQVEVRGRATDSAALTAKLAWWLRDFDGTRGPIRGAGRAPTLAEMREFRPHPADSVDVNEVVGWLVGKIKEKTKN